MRYTTVSKLLLSLSRPELAVLLCRLRLHQLKTCPRVANAVLWTYCGPDELLLKRTMVMAERWTTDDGPLMMDDGPLMMDNAGRMREEEDDEEKLSRMLYVC